VGNLLKNENIFRGVGKAKRGMTVCLCVCECGFCVYANDHLLTSFKIVFTTFG